MSTPETAKADMEKFLAQCEADFMKVEAFYSLSEEQIKELYRTYPKLLSYIRTLQSQNTELSQTIESQKQTHDAMLKKIEILVEDWKKMRQTLQELPMGIRSELEGHKGQAHRIAERHCQDCLDSLRFAP